MAEEAFQTAFSAQHLKTYCTHLLQLESSALHVETSSIMQIKHPNPKEEKKYCFQNQMAVDNAKIKYSKSILGLLCVGPYAFARVYVPMTSLHVTQELEFSS